MGFFTRYPPIFSSGVAADDLGMLPQPANPKFKTALLEIYVRNQPYGGSDKSSNGHRYDSIPFANGMITAGMSCQLLHYQHEEHDTFFEVCKDFNALIVRCNPGQINADGGSQAKFDDAIRELQKEGIQAWPSPDVMEFMGAKDALTKIATLNIGLEDTLTYGGQGVEKPISWLTKFDLDAFAVWKCIFEGKHAFIGRLPLSRRSRGQGVFWNSQYHLFLGEESGTH